MEEEEGEGPGNDQPTLSIRNTTVSQSERATGEMLITYPRPGLLGARGLDVGGWGADEGAHGELGVPRGLVREAPGAALVDVRQRDV